MTLISVGNRVGLFPLDDCSSGNDLTGYGNDIISMGGIIFAASTIKDWPYDVSQPLQKL